MDFLEFICEKAAEDRRVITAVVSSENVDRDGEIVTADAMAKAMPDFMQNGVVICAHEHKLQSGQSSVIGKVVKWWQEGKKTYAEIEFATTALANEYWELYRGKFQRAFSIGFAGLQTEKRFINGKTVRAFTRIELYEISAVAVPANREALSKSAQRKQSFVDCKQLQKDLQDLAPFDEIDIRSMDAEEKAYWRSQTKDFRQQMVDNAAGYGELVSSADPIPGDAEYEENEPESILAGKEFSLPFVLDGGEIAGQQASGDAVEPDYARLF